MVIDGNRQAMMNSDCLEGQFQELVHRSFIAPHQDKCESCTTKCYIRELNKWFDNIDSEKSVALYGCGKAANNTIGLLDRRHVDKIQYYSDKRASENTLMFNGENVIPAQRLYELNPDIVIICSGKYADDIQNDLLEVGFDKNKLVKLDYHIVRPLSRDFANNICPHFISQAKVAVNNNINSYEYIHDMINACDASEYCPDVKVKERALVNLIMGLLSIRDIVNAKKRIDEYMRRFDSLVSVFEMFLTQLNLIIENAARKISDRKSDAILIYLIDALPSSLVDNIPYLAKMKEESICFENSFTEYCWTTCSFQTILSGKDILKDKTYNMKHFSEVDSPFLRILSENGYDFNYSSTARPNLFDNKYLNKNKQHYLISTHFWHLLNEMSLTDKDSCYFLHIAELHDNVSSLSRKCKSINAQLTYSGCWLWQSVEMFRTLYYIDEQFSYYDKLMGANSTRIIMSDHGCDFDRYIYSFERDIKMETSEYTATTLIVKAPKLAQKNLSVDKLFSYKDFYKLLEWILSKRELETIFSEYLRIYNLPYYGEKMLASIGEISPIPMLGIVTQKGIYWYDYNGVETYYPMGCDTNMINAKEHETDIAYARSVCGNSFYGVLDNTKFALAKENLLKFGKIKRSS